MIIAIDGPAGAGKSTTARAVAARFGFAFIDTGAMYRAIALAADEAGLVPERDDSRIIEMARALPLRLQNGERVFIGEREVTHLIRAPHMDALTSKVSALPAVREIVVEQQRRLGRDSQTQCGGAVLEGRDIQTVVFPDADVKIFLTADAATRAGRRLQQRDDEIRPMEEVERDIRSRDQRDSTRPVSPLRAAPDAVTIATDGLSPEEVVERIAAIVRVAMQGKT